MFQVVCLRSNSGNFAILAAIRRASSRVNKFRRHLTFSVFSFADNNSATSCCHGSVVYPGCIFRDM
jgi:hypothetical protein